MMTKIKAMVSILTQFIPVASIFPKFVRLWFKGPSRWTLKLTFFCFKMHLLWKHFCYWAAIFHLAIQTVQSGLAHQACQNPWSAATEKASACFSKLHMQFNALSVRVYEEVVFSPRGPEPRNNNSNKQYHSNQTCK